MPKKSHRDTISCGKTITLRFLQGQDKDEFTFRHQFVISTAAALKTVFTTYSDTRGISLKTLRFSYGGKILFLSQIKNKTPTEMCMKDMDVVIVEDTSCQLRDPRKAGSFEKKISISDNVVKTNQTKSSNGSKRKKSRRNQTTKHIQRNSSVADNVKTEEELKIKHSKQLTKVHEELHPHLKQIRQRLNNLVLDRSRPKRIARKPSKNAATLTTQSFVDKSYIGRKAGTSHFIINAHIKFVQNMEADREQKQQQQHLHAHFRFARLHKKCCWKCTRCESSSMAQFGHDRIVSLCDSCKDYLRRRKSNLGGSGRTLDSQ